MVPHRAARAAMRARRERRPIDGMLKSHDSSAGHDGAVLVTREQVALKRGAQVAGVRCARWRGAQRQLCAPQAAARASRCCAHARSPVLHRARGQSTQFTQWCQLILYSCARGATATHAITRLPMCHHERAGVRACVVPRRCLRRACRRHRAPPSVHLPRFHARRWGQPGSRPVSQWGPYAYARSGEVQSRCGPRPPVAVLSPSLGSPQLAQQVGPPPSSIDDA